jgi:transcriptional regulator with XRE-family HTH domain
MEPMTQRTNAAAARANPSGSAVGTLLAHWRRARHKSQLALAHEADVSPRHVCFLETGRARPSRAMILQLARVLDIPLRERNALLLAAGFAPMYREADWNAPELAPARLAVDSILRHQEPYPAVVMNRHWDIVASNAAASRVFARFLATPDQPSPLNVVRLMFGPTGLRPSVRNWEAVAEALVRRVHREAVGGAPDAATAALLQEVLAYPGVPSRWRAPDLETPLLPFLPVSFAAPDLELNYFSAITTLGTPQDVTLQEIRIECFFPADPETAERSKQLADA